MKELRFSWIVVVFIILVACGGQQSSYFDNILKSEKGIVRGVDIGESIENVAQLEDSKFLKDKMGDYLHYDYTIDMGNTYTVTYDFSDEDELYEIELAVFLDKVEDAKSLFLDFNHHFTRKYGKGRIADDGFTIWKIVNPKTNIEIAMIDDSQAYGYLSIIIRDLDY